MSRKSAAWRKLLKWLKPLHFVPVLLSVGIGRAAAFGPGSPLIENPHDFADYGGTPDVGRPSEIGLQANELALALDRLTASNRAERMRAADEIILGGTGSEAVIRARLWERHNARNHEMKRAIRHARTNPVAGGRADPILEGLLSISPTEPELGRGATGALGILIMLRSLDKQDTLAAQKAMIEFAPRHAAVFRHEIGRLLSNHGLDVLPALIYSRSSPDNTVRKYAVRWIQDMGEPSLSEQIKIKNPRRLAQLLEAYGSVMDLDAIDVTLSMVNHPAFFVRYAARRALSAYGENAKWPVRRLYENSLGRPPRETAETEEMLQTLYDDFDAKRLTDMMDRFEAGQDAYQAGHLDQMADAYHQVLRKDPMFPKRHLMAEGFLALGDQRREQGDPRGAMAPTRTALRLANPDSSIAGRARAALEWNQAEKLLGKGILDLALYRSVVANDPAHRKAKERLKYLSGAATPPSRIITKSLAVSFLIFLACLLVYSRLRAG